VVAAVEEAKRKKLPSQVKSMSKLKVQVEMEIFSEEVALSKE
jgi:hypothetical protein